MDPEKFTNPEVSNLINTLITGYEELPRTEEINRLDDLWDETQANQNWNDLEEAWKSAPDRAWKPSRQMGVDEFCEMWQNMWPAEEFKDCSYMFEPNNPFLGRTDLDSCLVSTLEAGNISESILILEGMVMQTPNNVQAWIMLGKLNAENDEDIRSVSALRRGYELDPYNTEAMLALGIGLINAKQPQNAMEMLISWINHNPEFMTLNSSSVDLQDRVIDLYIQASNLHPEDSSLFQILGSLYFMLKEYDLAVSAFENSVNKDPSNYYSWNRLGAALAHQGNNKGAIQAYQKALEIRPHYVRAWANLGIAHANLDLMIDAARYYLCALYLNPKANHVWNYLVTAFACLSNGYLGRFDLLEKVKSFNPLEFQEEFQFVQMVQSGETWAQEFESVNGK